MHGQETAALADADAAGPGADETLVFHVDSSDWYGLVVWNQNDNAGTYVLGLRYPATLATGPGSATRPFGLRALTGRPSAAPTTIELTLESGGQASLGVYDVGGRRVRELLGAFVAAGTHRVVWDGRDQASRPAVAGVYILRLSAGGRQAAIKLVRAY